MAANTGVSNGPISRHQSQLKAIQFTYEWKIERCVEFLDRQFEIESEEFGPSSIAAGRWKLVLFTSDSQDYYSGWKISAKLIKMSDDGKPHSVKFTLSIVFNNLSSVQAVGEKVFRYFSDFDECVFVSYEVIKQKMLEFPDLTLRCTLDILHVDNLVQKPVYSLGPLAKHQASKNINNLSGPSSLSMDCDNDYLNEKTNNIQSDLLGDDNDSPSNFIEDSLKALSSDFEAMYLKRQFTDVNIIVEGKRFEAHRAVLAARSNFFSDIDETGKISISGVKSSVIESVLYYIYTGKTLSLNPNIALDLLNAALRFNLKPLEKLTIEFLKSKISMMNALDVLEVADEKSLDDLKHACLKFVSYNHSELEQTEKWQTVLRKNPRVAGQVLLAIASVQAPNII